MSHYAFLNISFQAREESCIVAKIMANIAEAFVFAYLGLTCLSININYISVSFILITILLIFTARFIAIFGLAMIVCNIKSLNISLTKSEKTIMTLSGFIRGAIAFGLAISVNASSDKIKQTLVSSTLVIVFITTIVIGGVLPCVIKAFKHKIINNTNNLNTDGY